MTKLQPGQYPPPWETMHHHTAAGSIALEVLRVVLEDEWGHLPPALQEHVLKKLPTLEASLSQKSKVAHKFDYTRWLDRISRTITSGERVENLLLDFFNQLEEFIKAGKSDALFALLMEQIEDDKGLWSVRLLNKSNVLIPDQLWKDFREKLHLVGRNDFFQSCLEPKNDLETVLARYIPHYNGELNDLVQASTGRARLNYLKGISVADKFWLSSIALPSDYAPPRCILLAYANTGDEFKIIPPQSAAEEQRVLQFLRIAYNQINYRIRDLPKFLDAHRRTWIRELAPSILAHEAATNIQIISDSAVQANQTLVALMKNDPELASKLASAAKLGKNVLSGTKNLMRTFSTYLNLQRKNRIEQFPIEKPFEEAWQLCKQRLTGIEVAIGEETSTRVIQSDRVLLTLIFTNILINAARAINEGVWPDGLTIKEKKIFLSMREKNDGEFHLILANSGPPIPATQSGKIFVQGYSTFADGHGQGLFVCRLICQHLGGNLSLAESADYEPNYNVAFDIKINPALTDIGEDSNE